MDVALGLFGLLLLTEAYIVNRPNAILDLLLRHFQIAHRIQFF